MAARLRDPLVLLAVLSVLSLAARIAWLSEPCHQPCRSASDHTLIFDEQYYVNAARVIAGIRPPAGSPYAHAPLGTDPNAEHPQLAKLIMAGSIELFGDGPFAWRIGSIVFGSLALLGLYALVRAAGGSRWLALGTSALMAADNLLIVHGRIGTLDIYATALMIWAGVFYLRGRPLAAGAAIGVGACMKLVAPYVLIVLAMLELLRSRTQGRERGARWRPFVACAAAAGGVFLALLALIDRIAPPYDPSTGKQITGGPFAHLAHMVSYASGQSSPHGPHGIASYPWQWLGDYKPIVYLNINPARPAPGLTGIHPAVHFLGMVSPPIMVLALPSLVLAALGLARTLPARARRLAPRPSKVAVVGLAWFLGTFLPFVLLSALWSRTSYLYYMVIVMPGIYIAVAELIARCGVGRRAIAGWGFAVLIAAILMYPLTPLP
jgi:predicted membrane-bound dolichyl-phosphate-mannose-protein mannosyltransferase